MFSSFLPQSSIILNTGMIKKKFKKEKKGGENNHLEIAFHETMTSFY